MDLSKLAAGFIITLNVFTIVFFFGFHFSAFKRLATDVSEIKDSAKATEKKVGETAEKVAFIEGRMSGRKHNGNGGS